MTVDPRWDETQNGIMKGKILKAEKTCIFRNYNTSAADLGQGRVSDDRLLVGTSHLWQSQVQSESYQNQNPKKIYQH